MPLATKNGLLIVKDGSIAGNCGCCAKNWYCCPPAACIAVPSSVSVTIAAEDYYTQYTCSDVFAESYQSSAIFLGNAMNGTTALTRISGGSGDGSTSSVWQTIFSAVPAGCPAMTLRFELATSSPTSTVVGARMYLDTTRIYSYSPGGVLSPSQLTCSLPTGTNLSGAYRLLRTMFFTWSKNCPGTTVDFSHTFAIEGTAITEPDSRTEMDAILAAGGRVQHAFSRRPDGYLATVREPNEKLATHITGKNSRSSNNLVTLTFTITE